MTKSSDHPESANAAGRARCEARERVELCRKLLASHVSDYDVERTLANTFGLSRRAAQRHLAAARQGMLAAAGRSRLEHRAEAYAFYCSLIAGSELKAADRIKAQVRIEKLLGLDPASPGEGSPIDGRACNIVWLLQNLHQSAPPPAGPPDNMTSW